MQGHKGRQRRRGYRPYSPRVVGTPRVLGAWRARGPAPRRSSPDPQQSHVTKACQWPARHRASERRPSYTYVRAHTRQSMQLAVPEDSSIREQGRQEVSNITINVTMPDGSAQTVEVGQHAHPYPRTHTTPARIWTSTGVPTHSCCENVTRGHARPHIRIMHACTLTCVHARARTHARTKACTHTH